MGFELRKVPKYWEHPKVNGEYVPLLPNYKERLEKWTRMKSGQILLDDYAPDDLTDENFEEHFGAKPDPADYMPDWSDEEATHFQRYENATEGTPVSPKFENMLDYYEFLRTYSFSHNGY